LHFLTSDELINDQLVDAYFFSTAYAVLTGLLSRAQNKASTNSETLTQALNELVTGYINDWRSLNYLGDMNEVTLGSLLVRYGDRLTDACNQIFGAAIQVEDTLRDDLKTIVALFMTKDVPHAQSGFVVAGFGESELFPSFIEYQIEGVIYQRFLRLRPGKSAAISSEIGANISPFAQAEMVHTFMTGVDPAFRENLDSVLSGLLDRFSQMAESQITADLAEDKVSQFRLALKDAVTASMNQFRQELTDYSRRRHIDPVIDAVALLPKDQLAVMAETLVALTSFKRRMSKDLETVGGAIDVAVISKGDGFVWIKRKHYFDAVLNPRFFDRLKIQHRNQQHADAS
jgi:hypothetical protein